ncbi:ABC-2 type transporter superfamily [Verrucomicrobiia bacterium DG1235]|nr:ABC-2 type transporter superfamily [Verrucomicrobiae bacterium DG1235]
MLGIYTFVFGYVFGGSFENETPIEHALGIFVGLAIHNFIAEMIVTTPQLMQSNAAFVKKVVFPLEVLVAARLGASLLTLVIKSALILSTALFLGKTPSMNIFGILALLSTLIVLAAGLGLFFAAIGVFVKDLSNAAQFMSMALLFGSAVFYPIAKIPPQAWGFLNLNPLVHIIDAVRNVVLWDQAIPAARYLVPCLTSIGLFALGSYVFQKLKPAFSDFL